MSFDRVGHVEMVDVESPVVERAPLCHAESTLLPENPPPDVGVASQDAPGKGEDTFAQHFDGDLAGFAIYDGHSGKLAAQAAARDLLPTLLSSGFPSPEAVTQGFWWMDDKIGDQRVPDGTTATVLLTERLRDDADLPYYRASLSWVGDSRALRVDLTQPYPVGAVTFATRNHSSRLDDEVMSMKEMMSLHSSVVLCSCALAFVLSFRALAPMRQLVRSRSCALARAFRLVCACPWL